MATTSSDEQRDEIPEHARPAERHTRLRKRGGHHRRARADAAPAGDCAGRRRAREHAIHRPNIRKPIGMLGGVGEGSSTFFDHLACSPDGQTVYYSTYSNSYAAKPQHVVYRLKWTDSELGEPFLGKKGVSGAADDQFDTPQGLAVDAQGRLYVCDQGNDRVMVFTPDGKLAASSRSPHPSKLPSIRRPEPSSWSAENWGGTSTPTRSAPSAVCRRGGQGTGHAGRHGLVRGDGARPLGRGPALVDRAPQSTPAGGLRRDEVHPGANVLSTKGLNYPMFLAADAARNCVYVGEYKEHITRIDLTTGEATPFLKKGIEPVVDRDGT